MAVAAPEPRPSASVILVRESQSGLETFMVLRHARSPVLPSAYVFPGGTVRSDDYDLNVDPIQGQELVRAVSERSDAPLDVDQAVGYYACALRELFEEAGVLLVRDASSALLTVDATDIALQERLAATRLALQARDRSLATLLADWRCRPAFDLLVPFSHWVTPALLVARFDTRFFVAEMPPGQAALHDTIETSDGTWRTPQQLLEGEYNVAYATAQHLGRLAPFRSVADLIAFARVKRIRRLSPEVVQAGSGLRAFIRPELVDAW